MRLIIRKFCGLFSVSVDTVESDIDILINLDRSVPFGLLDFARMVNSLEDRLKRKVDLVEDRSIKPRFRMLSFCPLRTSVTLQLFFCE